MDGGVANQTNAASPVGLTPYQSGCLIADAFDVPLLTHRLSEIEEYCVPWHFLFQRKHYVRRERVHASQETDQMDLVQASRELSIIPTVADDRRAALDMRRTHPTVDDLNDGADRDFDRAGVYPTTDEDRARVRASPDTERVRNFDRERLIERRIPRMLALDVSGGG